MNDIIIKTLPIEIKVVKVGNRQMTKSVFKQIALDHGLISEHLLFGGFENIYNILGWVNYIPEESFSLEFKERIWRNGFLASLNEIGEYDPKNEIPYKKIKNDPFVSILFTTHDGGKPGYLTRSIVQKYSIVGKYPQLFIAT